MKIKSFSIALLFFLALATILAGYGLASSPAKRSLTRTEDFVVLKGDRVPDLIGSPLEEIRFYSCSGKSCREVPLQIDKVDAEGKFVFPNGKDPERDGRDLDGNDEISFMAGDLGDRLPGYTAEGSVIGVEIEAKDPGSGARAWGYLFHVPGSRPSPDLPDYVGFEQKDGRSLVKADNFILGYDSDSLSYDEMRMRNGKGEFSEDVLDKQRIGMEAIMAGGQKIPINAPESIVKIKDIAWIDGPIRVVLDQVVVIRIVAVNFQYGMEYYLRFYRCGQHNSVDFSFPSGPNAMFESVLFYWSLDLVPQAEGFTYIDPNHMDPVKITTAEKKGIDGDDLHYWWGMYGPDGAVLQALDMDDDMVPYFGCYARWLSDPNAVFKKGEVPGKLDIGFNCRELGQMPDKKDYHWFNYILFPKEPSREKLLQMKEIFESPLEVGVASIPTA